MTDIGAYIQFTGMEHLESDMREAGFVDIKVKKIRIDIGNWRGGNDHDFYFLFFI